MAVQSQLARQLGALGASSLGLPAAVAGAGLLVAVGPRRHAEAGGAALLAEEHARLPAAGGHAVLREDDARWDVVSTMGKAVGCGGPVVFAAVEVEVELAAAAGDGGGGVVGAGHGRGLRKGLFYITFHWDALNQLWARLIDP
uniref:Uncharacterized protein n=1 Tax=Oryza brachyantha TaxID=4533 RepID=J3M6L7_ORYBR